MAKGNRGGQRARGAAAKTAPSPGSADTNPATAGTPGVMIKDDDYPEAFQPGKDYQKVGGVDHAARTVSGRTQREWDAYASQMSKGVTAADESALMKDWNPRTNEVYGYVRTTNAFAINKALYDPQNAGKTTAQIFRRPQDRATVATLDKSIRNNVTPADASYVRFSNAASIQRAYGLTQQEMNMIAQAPRMNAAQLAQLNKVLSGKTSFTKSYTSTSANRTLNAFSNPNAPQSRGYYYERKLNVPKGTNAYAPMQNAQESEVIFGRGMGTKLKGVSVGSDGHIVFHETFDGYK